MGASKPAGNANFPIGGGKAATNPHTAIQENGAPRKPAIQENGAPGKPAIRENGAPGWRSRGYIPHFESPTAIQHVTFHLADSLPKTVLIRLQNELKFLPAEKRPIESRKRIEAWIDAGHGSCILRTPAVADMVQHSLLNFDSQRYRLFAWVVMPNHVHALFAPIDGWTAAKIVASWKKFTARQICGNANLLIGGALAPPIWHREYWDRYIRDERHFKQAVEYIHQNPVKAGLVEAAGHWRWSSAGNANLPIGGVNAGNADLRIGGVDIGGEARGANRETGVPKNQ